MSAAIHHFPTPAAYVATLQSDARIAEVITAARAVLRSEHRHGDDILTEACVALKTWGGGSDWLEAGAMLVALRLRQRNQAVAEAQAAVKPGTIRRWLVDAAGLTVIVAVALTVYVGGV